MGELYLLDTNVLVHYVRADAVWRHIQAMYSLLFADPQPLICVVSAGELRSLAHQFNWLESRRAQMDFILNYFEWVNFDREPVLRDYALIDAYTRKEGKSLQKNDLWIAASAQSIGARILTTDRDFDFIHGLFVRRELIDLTVPPAGSP